MCLVYKVDNLSYVWEDVANPASSQLIVPSPRFHIYRTLILFFRVAMCPVTKIHLPRCPNSGGDHVASSGQ